MAVLASSQAWAQAPRPVISRPQASVPGQGGGTVEGILASDIHFDPFADPGKVSALVSAPVEEWEELLGGASSPRQAEAVAHVRRSCGGEGEDTTIRLLRSSLAAMRAEGRKAKFVLLAGDLLAHDFECRFKASSGPPESYRGFVNKTLAYVARAVRVALPGVPVYITLGNNDSDCGDYRLDADSSFLATTAGDLLGPFVSPRDRYAASKSARAGGYYSVLMPAPLSTIKLIVLNSSFFSRKYATCGGARDSRPGAAELDWLAKGLDRARQQGSRVWVLGHVPPGVDLYSTVSKLTDVCGGAPPPMFLSSSGLAEVLIQHADVVSLAVFSHTHNDEWRLLEREQTEAAPGVGAVPVKLVSSISPFHGNSPSFTRVRVDPRSGTLVDYQVFTASDRSGTGTRWSLEYAYSEAYHVPDFSASSLTSLLAAFHRDSDAADPASTAYLRNYFAGEENDLIKPFWRQYVCSMDHHTETGYAACSCAQPH